MRFVGWLGVLAILGLPESARAQACDRKPNATVATAYKMKVPWRAARKKAAPHREVARIRVGEDFVVCDGDVDFIRVDPPRKELWGGSFIVMWDPADGKLEVSGVDEYGRSVAVVTFADDPGRGGTRCAKDAADHGDPDDPVSRALRRATHHPSLLLPELRESATGPVRAR